MVKLFRPNPHQTEQMTVRTMLLLVCLALVACASKESAEPGSGFGPAQAPASAGDQPERQRHLAYEHTIAIDVDEPDLKPTYEKLLTTCQTDREIDCTVLDASMNASTYLYAKLRLRAKPQGASKLLATASASGKVTSQSTHVEDLAKPIADLGKRLDMLKDYRTKLLELQQRPNNDVDASIKIAEKLAAVQSDIERAGGESAHLQTRVELEILNVSLSTRAYRSFWAPIGDSLGEFPANLSFAVSAAITGIAFALPWLALLVIAIVMIRLTWRWLRRR